MRASDWAGRIGETWAEKRMRTGRSFAPVACTLRYLDGAACDRLAAALNTLVRDHRDEDRIVFPAAAWIWRARA